MTELSAAAPSSRRPSAATVGEVMRSAVTTAEQDAHLAAAAYLIKHAGATALVVVDDPASNQPVGIITETDIVHAVADGMDLNQVRIRDVMTREPTDIGTATGIREAAESMMRGRFRHLPVVDGTGLVGMVDINDVCRALLDQSTV
jgi:CBS domain-containing protein